MSSLNKPQNPLPDTHSYGPFASLNPFVPRSTLMYFGLLGIMAIFGGYLLFTLVTHPVIVYALVVIAFFGVTSWGAFVIPGNYDPSVFWYGRDGLEMRIRLNIRQKKYVRSWSRVTSVTPVTRRGELRYSLRLSLAPEERPLVLVPGNPLKESIANDLRSLEVSGDLLEKIRPFLPATVRWNPEVSL